GGIRLGAIWAFLWQFPLCTSRPLTFLEEPDKLVTFADREPLLHNSAASGACLLPRFCSAHCELTHTTKGKSSNGFGNYLRGHICRQLCCDKPGSIRLGFLRPWC